MEIVLCQVAHHDITNAVGYLAELWLGNCGDGSKLGMELGYSLEGQSLGTTEPISLISNLQEVILVMNGDLMTMIRRFKNFPHIMMSFCLHNTIGVIH